MTCYYNEELSELAGIYKDKLEESLNEEGYPDELHFEDAGGEVIRYLREDAFNTDDYDEYKIGQL